jgi:hypothetical protein
MPKRKLLPKTKLSKLALRVRKTKKKKPVKVKLVKTQLKFKNIMSCDCGLKNFGFSVLRGKKIAHVGFIENTITNLIDPYYGFMRHKFVVEFEQALNTFSPDCVVMERFQNRGKMMGSSCELVNVMIGIVTHLCDKRKIYLLLITASQWKNQFQRQFPFTTVSDKGKELNALETLYEELKPFPPHLIDAHLQGSYCSNLNHKNQFDGWKKSQIAKVAKAWIKIKQKEKLAKKKVKK